MNELIRQMLFNVSETPVSREALVFVAKLRLFVTFPVVWFGTGHLFSSYYVPETSPPALIFIVHLWCALALISFVGDVIIFVTRHSDVQLPIIHAITVVCIVCILLANQLVGAQFGSVSSQTLLNAAILIALYRIFLGYRSIFILF